VKQGEAKRRKIERDEEINTGRKRMQQTARKESIYVLRKS
jgi:hypothetical protein